MKIKMTDAKELLKTLAMVDENHFAIVENECVGVYSREDFVPMPMPYGSCVLEIPDDKVSTGLLERDRTDGNI